MPTISPPAPAENAVIKSRPRYPDGFSGPDSALRNEGWLDPYPAGSGSDIFVGEDNGGMVGFSILRRDNGNCPEFRIALYSAQLGRGSGSAATARPSSSDTP
ncbi:MAG: hypothetical protein LUP97_00315 [Methanoregula sp.]|nr:hypothetical protein [Methanoregula sp.]